MYFKYIEYCMDKSAVKKIIRDTESFCYDDRHHWDASFIKTRTINLKLIYSNILEII